mmetsp:Transcript_7042/g.24449  ORF Transcript_7042/g.24449 Transcript_7042/m.24449 type:complete len:267 (-) Transcript_7042:358-1158(-)
MAHVPLCGLQHRLHLLPHLYVVREHKLRDAAWRPSANLHLLPLLGPQPPLATSCELGKPVAHEEREGKDVLHRLGKGPRVVDQLWHREALLVGLEDLDHLLHVLVGLLLPILVRPGRHELGVDQLAHFHPRPPLSHRPHLHCGLHRAEHARECRRGRKVLGDTHSQAVPVKGIRVLQWASRAVRSGRAPPLTHGSKACRPAVPWRTSAAIWDAQPVEKTVFSRLTKSLGLWDSDAGLSFFARATPYSESWDMSSESTACSLGLQTF